MLAPVPDDPVFTDGLRTLSEDAPLFLLELLRETPDVTARIAVFVGGGGGAGGGGGSGILGDDMHIVLFFHLV